MIYITILVIIVLKIRKLKHYIYLVFLLIVSSIITFGQTTKCRQKVSEYRIIFYNVENYFDYTFDSTLNYNEFTPDGNLHWTKEKYEKKRNNIYKVVKAIGGWNPVALIGLAEVENEFVVSDLINNTPLRNDGYEYIHFDSDDKRGIDVALLYHKESFKVIFCNNIAINDPNDESFTTRDLLYVKGKLGSDTIHVVVNHWTSRYRGYLESEPYRILASETVLKLTDSIYKVNNNSNILLMGDFNDNPDNESIQLLTGNSRCGLKSLPVITKHKDVRGTLKHKNKWTVFDQIIASQNLLDTSNQIQCDKHVVVFDDDFLLQPDDKYLGVTTYRTNLGFTYKGGFSDHLPIYVDIKKYVSNYD